MDFSVTTMRSLGDRPSEHRRAIVEDIYRTNRRRKPYTAAQVEAIIQRAIAARVAAALRGKAVEWGPLVVGWTAS
jgi:hypothetical protein